MLSELADLARQMTDLADEIAAVADTVKMTLRDGGCLFFCGNGGSAAEAQHLAAEFVVRFRADRDALAAIALTGDAAVMTAVGNDLGFQEVFARQVKALCRPKDLLVLLSTSGESENLIRAAAVATQRGVRTVAFLAKGGGRLAAMVDRALVVPTDSTARAQEIHLAIGHIICQLVEAEDAPALIAEVERLRALTATAPQTQPEPYAFAVECRRGGKIVRLGIPHATKEAAEANARYFESYYDQPRDSMYIVCLYRGAVPQQWQPIHEADLSENRLWSVIVYVPGDDGVTNGVVGEARYHEDAEAWMWAGTDPTDHWAHPVYPTHWMPLPAAPQVQETDK